MCKHDIPAFAEEDSDPVEQGAIDPPADPWEDAIAQCPTCGGIGEPLGSLGRLDWYRCQSCGQDYDCEAW